MTDKSQPDRKKLNPPKHIAVLVLGLLMTGIAEGFALYNPSAYTTGALVFIFLTRPIIYFVLLGVVALIISACRNNVKKFWFPALAWLFFAAGVFDVAMEGYANLILRPQIAKGYYRDRKPDQGSLCDLMIFSGENNAYSIAVDAMKWTYGSDDMPGAEFKFYHRDADIWGFVIPERTTTSITNLRALVISELKNSLSGIEILKNEIGNINDTQVLTLKIRLV